jgi:hypothetical protein
MTWAAHVAPKGKTCSFVTMRDQVTHLYETANNTRLYVGVGLLYCNAMLICKYIPKFRKTSALKMEAACSSGRVVDWLWWGETEVSELRPYEPIVLPRVTAIWTMVWWYRLGLTHNSSTRALRQPPVLPGGPANRDISGASRRIYEENYNLF